MTIRPQGAGLVLIFLSDQKVLTKLRRHKERRNREQRVQMYTESGATVIDRVGKSGLGVSWWGATSPKRKSVRVERWAKLWAEVSKRVCFLNK